MIFKSVRNNMTGNYIEMFTDVSQAKEFIKQDDILFVVGATKVDWSAFSFCIPKYPEIARKFRICLINPKNLYSQVFRYLKIEELPCVVVVRGGVIEKPIFFDTANGVLDEISLMGVHQ